MKNTLFLAVILSIAACDSQRKKDCHEVYELKGAKCNIAYRQLKTGPDYQWEVSGYRADYAKCAGALQRVRVETAAVQSAARAIGDYYDAAAQVINVHTRDIQASLRAPQLEAQGAAADAALSAACP
jgi:hypothetical protein